MSLTRRSTRLSNVKIKPQYRDVRISSEEDENVENFSMNSSIRTPRRRNATPRPQQTAIIVHKTPLRQRETKRRQQHEKPAAKSISSELESSDEISTTAEENNIDVSPPKQQKFQNNPQNLFSPSRLLDRLSIEDHENDDDDNGISKQTEEKNESKFNKYQNARRVLNSSETNQLPGRELELEELSKFFNDHLENQKSGSLYISGQPGTGKTACLSKLLKSKDYSMKFTKVYINCTSISTIGSVYKKITAELNCKVHGQQKEKDHLLAIEKYLISKHKIILLVLDEIDQLCGQKQKVLYTIFEWPSIPQSRILLIGIANSLDLTDRMLIRLNAKCELKPKLMHFAPYNKQQIIDIFKSRLEEAGVMDIFPPVTIQLLAAKVSAISGDVRRALDIGRRVVQIAEMDKNGEKKKLVNNIVDELGIDSLKHSNNDDDDALKPVQVKQVVSVLNTVYGTSQSLNNDIESSFPLQQKFLLCCLMLILKKGKNKDITVGRLHDVYKRVCLKKNVMAVDQAEFVGLCSLVDTRGIIRVIKKKEPRLSKVVLQWDETEVSEALKDKQLISTILDDVSCLEGR